MNEVDLILKELIAFGRRLELEVGSVREIWLGAEWSI